MSELTALTIAEARDKLKAKAITATELTRRLSFRYRFRE